MAVMTASTVVAKDKLLIMEKQRVAETPGDNRISRRGLTPDRYQPVSSSSTLERKHPWSLPKQALAPTFLDTIDVLVLRFNFQEEDPDDPNTTGNGVMDLSDPMADPVDSINYYKRVKHWVDPPPHDSAYFDAHLRALRRYWEWVSERKITLSWDIFPPEPNSVYQLPQPMNHYGKCDFDLVVSGLEQYFIDCITTADSMSPEIDFSDYEAIILFHAGADRQMDWKDNSCSDLFTGFIAFGDSIAVDDSAHYVRTAVMMPEAASQDNRATALNAVLAHEFGHQLGLVDIYSTQTFMSQLGDFALMDNNGFGTGIDPVPSYLVGRVFGAVPLYPCAWSRAFLGFVEVHDYRQGSDIRLVAAEVISQGIEVARIPISENEYYLIENRVVDTDGRETAMRVDSATNVYLGPSNFDYEYTGEYDFLMPGAGMLIYLVDEAVAGLDYDGDGLNNFDDNDLQWTWDYVRQQRPGRKFITLIEADGLINFGGYYRYGWGKPEDMFRDDRTNSFTPNTNPATIDNSGNNTHICITGITRDTAMIPGTGIPMLLDTVMLFDVETEWLTAGFPVRAGRPLIGLSPIVDDLDRDGTDEIIVVSGPNLLAITTTGENFLRNYTDCDTCPVYYDITVASVYPADSRRFPLPMYAQTSADMISAGPVTGDFGLTDSNRFVAIGYATGSNNGRVDIRALHDNNLDGQADPVGQIATQGMPIALSFGTVLYALTDQGQIYLKDGLQSSDTVLGTITNDEYHGLCRLGDRLVVMAGDAAVTWLYCFDGVETDSFSLGSYFNYGPLVVDLNRDDTPELTAFSPDGRAIVVTIDTGSTPPTFAILHENETGFGITTNPVAGDIDNNGYPDIILGGFNTILAFNRELTLMTDFPIEINDRFPNDRVEAAPVLADIRRGGPPEVIFPTFVGNVYSFGLDLSYGFPLSGGEQVRGTDSTVWIGGYYGAGSPVIFSDSTGGKLGYLGSDGWFYAWEVDLDTVTNYWPMNGHDPEASYAFESSGLSSPEKYTTLLPEERFYNYPNPVIDGQTTIRYFLGEDAVRVEAKIYDLSGVHVKTLTSSGISGGVDHDDLVWNCSDVTPGVYRCVLEVDFGDQIEIAFTDIAVIR